MLIVALADRSPAVRAAVAEALVGVGNPQIAIRTVKAWRAPAGDPPPDATETGPKLPDEGSLLFALSPPTPTTQAAAEWALGELVSRLILRLSHDTEWAARALAELGDPRATPHLAQVLDTGCSPPAQRSVISALVALCDVRAVPALVRRAAASVRPEGPEAPGWVLREAATEAVLQFGATAVPALREATHALDAGVAETAAHLLGKVGDPSGIGALVQALKRRLEEGSAEAAGQLACGGDAGLRALIEVSQSGGPNAREWARMALCKADAGALGEMVLDAVLSEEGEFGTACRGLALNAELRMHVVDGWAALGAAAVDRLLQLLHCSEAKMRLWAVLALIRVPQPRVRAELRTLVVDAQTRACTAAAIGLGLLRDPLAREVLIVGLSDPDPDTRAAAALSLAALGARAGGALADLRDARASEGSLAVRAAYASAITAIEASLRAHPAELEAVPAPFGRGTELEGAMTPTGRGTELVKGHDPERAG